MVNGSKKTFANLFYTFQSYFLFLIICWICHFYSFFTFLFLLQQTKTQVYSENYRRNERNGEKIPLMLFMFLPLSVREVKNYFFFLEWKKSYRLYLLCEIKSIVIREWGGGSGLKFVMHGIISKRFLYGLFYVWSTFFLAFTFCWKLLAYT